MKKVVCLFITAIMLMHVSFAEVFYGKVDTNDEVENKITREEFFALIGGIEEIDANLELLDSFEDLSEVSEDYRVQIARLIGMGIVSGNIKEQKVYLEPKKPVTRLETAIILTKFLGIYSTAPASFSDSSAVPKWANEYVSSAINFGIMSLGKNGNFRPYDEITYNEITEMLDRLLAKGYFDAKNISVYAGNGVNTLSDDVLNEASFYSPTDIIKLGNALYVSDTNNNVIRKIENDEVKTVVGTPGVRDENGVAIGSFEDGEDAKFDGATFLAKPKSGLLISDTNNNVIRYLSGDKVTTYAGNVEGGYKDAKRGRALFNNPTGIVATSKGVVYIADTGNNVIRKIDRNDNVTTYAGIQSENGGLKDGLAKEAMFNRPMGLALKGDVLYVADCGNQRIRKIENGRVTTVAGGGFDKYDESNEIIGDYIDGESKEARFNFPRNVIVDEEGNIYVADTGNSAIRKIDKNGNVYTIMGLSANDEVDIVSPVGLLIDGNKLYVTDTSRNNIVVMDIREVE